MSFDKSLLKCLCREEGHVGIFKFAVEVNSYNQGSMKIRINRSQLFDERYKNKKLGNLDVVEAEKVCELLKEVLYKIEMEVIKNE